jgi:hypothetical protein
MAMFLVISILEKISGVCSVDQNNWKTENRNDPDLVVGTGISKEMVG